MSRRRARSVGAWLAGWLAVALVSMAASPSPGTDAGDPRSSGQGPGLVGDPGFAVLAVVVIGLATVLATLAWVRMTSRSEG